jgi:putative ABC transport system substrate-binding protein
VNTWRHVLLGLAGTLVARPLGVLAQSSSRVYRVGVVMWSAPAADLTGPEPRNPAMQAVVQGLGALGYIEGQNLILERRIAAGRLDSVPDLIAELVALKVDVLLTSSNAVAAGARKATKTVPIVMVGVVSPVEGGLVASLARPGGNVTGVTLVVADVKGD